MSYKNIKNKLINNIDLDEQDAIYILNESTNLEELFELVSLLDERIYDKKISLCAIVNIKNGSCSEDCSFCAQSKAYNSFPKKADLLRKDVVLEYKKSLGTIPLSYFSLVASGYGPDSNDLLQVLDIIKSADKKHKWCASLGVMSFEDLLSLKNAGFKRYHHNLEAAPSLFPKICSSHSIKERVQTVKNALRAGLEVCCGGIFGIGETNKDIVELAVLLKKLGVHSIPLNFLIPIKGTPMAERGIISHEQATKIIIMFRLFNKSQEIRICGGREEVFKDKQDNVFKAGIDGMMIDGYLTRGGNQVCDDLDLINEAGITVYE